MTWECKLVTNSVQRQIKLFINFSRMIPTKYKCSYLSLYSVTFLLAANLYSFLVIKIWGGRCRDIYCRPYTNCSDNFIRYSCTYCRSNANIVEYL